MSSNSSRKVIGSIIGIVVFIIFENKPKVKKLSFIDGIINRIDNEEELLLFMTDDISVCGACGDDLIL